MAIIKFGREDYFAELKRFCLNHSFTCRGKAFFRVIGDGVLQVLKWEKYRVSPNPRISVGLFSLYGELEQQWLTSFGCIPRYPIYKLFVQDPLTIEGVLHGLPIQDQLRVFEEKGIEWLDGITTQCRLAEGICELDSATGGVRWNDLEKFAPYLHSGNLETAQKVLQAILDQHHQAAISRKDYLSPEEYQQYCAHVRSRDEVFLVQLDMVCRRDTAAISNYLDTNYARNSKLTAFCRSKK